MLHKYYGECAKDLDMSITVQILEDSLAILSRERDTKKMRIPTNGGKDNRPY